MGKGSAGNWRDEYGHERVWKKADPLRAITPYPDPDDSLASALRSYLEGRELDANVATRLGGWYGAYYRGPRIIIPCLRSDGGIWWQARLIETAHVVMTASEVMGLAKRWDGARGYRGDAVCYIPAEYERPTIIVEGPMDALAAAGCGFPAIAILGATPPQLVYDQVVRLVNTSYRKGQCVILPDNDRLAAWQDTQAALGQRGVYGRIQALPGQYKDLAEMPERERFDFLHGAQD